MTALALAALLALAQAAATATPAAAPVTVKLKKSVDAQSAEIKVLQQKIDEAKESRR